MSIDQKELAKRLRKAREAVGLTQDEAAAAIGIPRPSVAQIEAAKRAVSGLELDRFATLYRKDVRELLDAADGMDPVAHFRHDDELIDLPDLADALQDCLRFGRELAELERLTGVDRASPGAIRYDLPVPISIGVAMEQGTQTADAERRRLGLAEAPVEDVVDLLENNGIRTALLDMPDAISGLMLAEPGAAPLVVTNRTHHIGRRAFSFAHEYAHALVDRERRALVTRGADTSDPLEVRANAFAAAFLMPEAGVRRRLAEFGKSARRGAVGADGPTDARPANAVRLHDVALLAAEFKVTRAAIITRLRSLRVFTQKQAQAMRDDDAKSGSAVARLLGLREPDHAGERDRFRRRFARLALDAYGRGDIDERRLVDHLVKDAGMEAAQVAEAIRPARDAAK